MQFLQKLLPITQLISHANQLTEPSEGRRVQSVFFVTRPSCDTAVWILRDWMHSFLYSANCLTRQIGRWRNAQEMWVNSGWVMQESSVTDRASKASTALLGLTLPPLGSHSSLVCACVVTKSAQFGPQTTARICTWKDRRMRDGWVDG